MKKFKLLFLLTTFLATGTCAFAQSRIMLIYKDDNVVNIIDVSRIDSIKFVTNKELILQIKERAVDTLTIGSNRLVLDAFLWRNFAPISLPSEQAMASVNWLFSINMVKIPNSIRMVRQYVIYEDEIWVAEYEGDAPSARSDYMIERISRNGPKWDPGIYADVISQIHDSQNNKDYYIRLKNVFLERAD